MSQILKFHFAILILLVGHTFLASEGFKIFTKCKHSGRNGFLEHLKRKACPPLSNFPSHIRKKVSTFKNWAQQIRLDHVWIVFPKNEEELLTVVNWAFKNGFNVRPVGFMHNWSPLVVTGEEKPCSNIILIETLAFDKVEMSGPNTVRAQAGLSLEGLLTFLENNGKTILGHPAPGGITIGGVLAIGGHGTGIQKRSVSSINPSETVSSLISPITSILWEDDKSDTSSPRNNNNYGTMSNLISSITAIVWDQKCNSYVLQTFYRNEPEAAALLIHLGRIFVVEVELEVSNSVNIRCVSIMNVGIDELFAHPEDERYKTSPNTAQSLTKRNGGFEVIWWPFTNYPWIKTWTESREKPQISREVKHPYNYPISDNIPIEVNDILSQLLSGDWGLAPALSNVQLKAVKAGLLATKSYDLWGPSKNVFLYVKRTTLRVTANGYAVLTRFSNVQRIIHEFTKFYNYLIEKYANQRKFPINGPLEIRITKIDKNSDPINKPPPALSPLKPVDGHPELDTGIWLDCLSFPTTPAISEFMNEIEDWLLNDLQLIGGHTFVRAEWSKGFAYTNNSAWTDPHFLRSFIPKQAEINSWNSAVKIYNNLDPHKIFSNKFLRKLLRKKFL